MNTLFCSNRERSTYPHKNQEVNPLMDNPHRGTHSAVIIQVIQTMTSVGTGTEADPNRVIIEYWSLDGELLAVSDPMEQDALPQSSHPQSP